MAIEGLASKNPHLKRAWVQFVATHWHQDFVKPLIEIIQKCPPEDTHLRHAARISLRNCLGLRESWAVVKALPADATEVVMTEAVLSVENPLAADYLASAITSQKIPEHRSLPYVEHVGRYAAWDERTKVIRWAVGKSDKGWATTILSALVRGVQPRAPRPGQLAGLLNRVSVVDSDLILAHIWAELQASTPEARMLPSNS